WQGNLQAVQDATFASQGSWYGLLAGMPPAGGSSVRKIAFQFLPANPTNGHTFVAIFDARVGNPGFNAIGVEFFAHNSNGTYIGTATGPVTVSNLITAMWTTYRLEFNLNDGWDGVGPVSL